MSHYHVYQCCLCGAIYPPQDVLYTCTVDGENLDIVLNINHLRKEVSPEEIFKSSEASLWRYLPLLPVSEPGGFGTPLHSVGWTPWYHSSRLAEEFGLHNVFVKDEGRNPTASLKDRASAVVVARAKQIDAQTIVTASTGNAGAALAGMAAALGSRAVIFAPQSAPQAKIAQLLIFGARVILVRGNYDAAFDLSIEAAKEFGWYCRNTGYNPFTVEGKKTAAYEIWEQGLRKLPKTQRQPAVFVSVGDGNIISGLYKGFKDLVDLGWLEQMPRLFGIQAEGSAAIFNAFRSGAQQIEPVVANTLADSIAVDLPRDGFRALRAVRETQGDYLTVNDAEILEAIPKLGKYGIFIEPAGAAAFAGLTKACKSGLIQPDDQVIVLNTGNGLKDIKAGMQAVPAPEVIEPTMEALKKLKNLVSGN